MNIEKQTYTALITQIGSLLQQGRKQAIQSVNTILVQTYWAIGQHIVEFEQKGSERAEYGSQLLDNLSKDLTITYGKGFSRSNIFQIRQFYIRFQNIQTVSGQLTWSHYAEILKANNDLELSFYTNQCQHERWSVRELKRQMKSSLFERLALSKDKEGILRLAKEGHIVEKAEDLIKDPFVLDFLNIPEQYQYLESELEEKIISQSVKLQVFYQTYRFRRLTAYRKRRIPRGGSTKDAFERFGTPFLYGLDDSNACI